jgi:hypothetical protein
MTFGSDLTKGSSDISIDESQIKEIGYQHQFLPIASSLLDFSHLRI